MGNTINGLIAIILIIVIVIIIFVPIFPYEECAKLLGYNVACVTKHVSLLEVLLRMLK